MGEVRWLLGFLVIFGGGFLGLVSGKIPVIFLHSGICFPPFSAEQAALMAKEVYFIGELGCEYLQPTHTQIIEKDVHLLFSSETDEVERLYPRVHSFYTGGMTEMLRTYEITCIQRYFMLRDLMVEENLQVAMYLDSDILLYVEPDELYKRISEYQGFGPDITLVSEVIATAPAYISFWTIKGLQVICDFILQVMRQNTSFPFNDMILTSLYYKMSRKESTTIIREGKEDYEPNMDGCETPVTVVIMKDTPEREYGMDLMDGDMPMIFDWKFDGNETETSYLRLPAEEDPRRPGVFVEGHRVFFCHNRALLFDVVSNEFVSAGALHMRGPMKDLIPFYRPWYLDMPCICDDLFCQECLQFNDFYEAMPQFREPLEAACNQFDDGSDANADSIEEDDYY